MIELAFYCGLRRPLRTYIKKGLGFRLGGEMTCPECQSIIDQYRDLRRAVLEFAQTLDDYERERRRKFDAERPAGMPPLTALLEQMDRDAGCTLPGVR